MYRIRRILVAVRELSTESQPAVAKAAQIARACGAQVELFHALDSTLYLDGLLGQSLAQLENTLRAKALKQLEALAARLHRLGVKTSVTAAWDFPVYEAILRQARRSKADLIVVENHRRRHRFSRLLHLNDWELLRLSPVPVLLVKSPRPYHRPTVLAAVDPSHAFEKPIRLDDEILRVGGAVAQALRGSLHAVYANIPIATKALQARVRGEPVDTQTLARYTVDAATRAKAHFERLLRPLKIPPARRHLTTAAPTEAIARTAHRTRSAIVVMGVVSRSGLKGLLIGNTAESLLDRLACDLLIVKPVQFKHHLPARRRGARIATLSTEMNPF